MNSKKNKNRFVEQPLFRFDPETGKRVLLPMKFSSPKSNSKCKSSEKTGKRMLLLTPLKLTAADFEEPSISSSKIRKTDNNSVRKELFNVPSKGSSKPRRSLNTRRTLSRRSVPSNKVQQNKFKPAALSPLLDMEEVEEELINKNRFLQGYPFKTPSKPAIKFTSDFKNSPLRSQNQSDERIPTIKVNDIEMTPESTSSNETEFLELEKICRVEDPGETKDCDKSPISSVCNLLEGTVINSSKKEKINKSDTSIQQNVIRDIENMLCENKTAFEEYKANHEKNIYKITELFEADRKQYENLITLQEKNINSITNILTNLKCSFSNVASREETNKENIPGNNRRSIRLLNKSPIQTNGAKLIVSPGVSRSRDLRKSTLTKNLVTKTQQYNIDSPRIKKALDMYNSMRCEVSVLATPKLDRNYLNESPRSTNLSKNLSRRLQNQCLLLQDTPIHK